MGNILFDVDIAGIIADVFDGNLMTATVMKRIEGERRPGALTAGRRYYYQFFDCQGFWEDYTRDPPPGITVELGDRKALLIGDTIQPGGIPERNDLITIEGQTLAAVQLQSRDPAAAVYTYQCRDRGEGGPIVQGFEGSATARATVIGNLMARLALMGTIPAAATVIGRAQVRALARASVAARATFAGNIMAKARLASNLYAASALVGALRIVPSFDFTNGTLPFGVTLARAGSATRINQAGALVTEAADVPRFEYRNGVLLGLLIEADGINLFRRSQDFTITWTTVGSAPSTATALIEDATSGQHYKLQSSGTLTQGQSYVQSADGSERTGSAKRYLLMFVPGGALAANAGLCFDLATLTYTMTGGGTVGTEAGFEDVGNGVVRPWWRWTAVASVAAAVRFALSNTPAASTSSYQGDGSSGLNITNMQLEPGTRPTSRMISDATMGTRIADVVTLNWASRNVPDGAITVRDTFDDLSTQDMARTVAGGITTVPTNLNRARVRRIERI